MPVEPGDHVAVIVSGRTGFVLREADPDHPMEDPARVLVRWHDDGTQGWPFRKYLRIAVPEDLDPLDDEGLTDSPHQDDSAGGRS